MKLLWTLAVIPAIALAEPPRRVIFDIDQGRQRTVLLADSCGWPGGALRAYEESQGQIRWGCWGFDDRSIQIYWTESESITIPYKELGAGARPSCDTEIACPIQVSQSITYEQFYQRYQQVRK